MGIPAYRNILLQDMKSLAECRSFTENPFTALSFQSMYTWKDALQLTGIHNKDFCSVYSKSDKGYFCPMGKKDRCREWIRFMVKNRKPFKLMYLTSEQAECLASKYHAEIQINRDLSEYLYESEALAFQKKPSRNFKDKVHWFQKRFDYEVISLTENNLFLLNQILYSEIERQEHDASVLQNMISSFEKLKMKGILLRGSENFAFIIGYENTPEIFTMSLVKSTPEWHSISVSVCEHEFVKRLYDKYQITDLEEDLGIEGLRNVKTLTKPIRMLDAWEAYFT